MGMGRGDRRGWRRARVLLALTLILTLAGLPLLGLTASAEAPPVVTAPGFSDIAISTVYGSPTDLAWLGDDLLIAAQEGWLFRLADASPASEPVMILDLSGSIGKGPEQGLLGVIPDPDYPKRPYIYVFYTGDRGTGHCDRFPANCRNVVSRFTMGEDGLLDPHSEAPLLDTIMVGTLHNAGDLAFNDGWLYVSTGDAGYWHDARDLSNLNGKILRIDRDGRPAPGNPFAVPDAVPCQEAPRRGTGAPCPEIFAYGLRNPFRIAFDPNVEDIFYINDVGQASWEEVNFGIMGANYGWPEREGLCPTGEGQGCQPADALVEPIYAYPHESGCFAITGGAFVPAASAWGAAYQGKYLFADWGCGMIFALGLSDGGVLAATPFVTGLTTITPILFSPDGNTLYYGREGGIVHAITNAPEAIATPGP